MFNLGVAYKESNQLNQAIEIFSKLIVAQPDFPNAYYERGFCYGRMGLFPQANADMIQSIAFQPEHGASYFSGAVRMKHWVISKLHVRIGKGIGIGHQGC